MFPEFEQGPQTLLPTVPSQDPGTVPGTPQEESSFEFPELTQPVTEEPTVEPTVVSSDLAREDFKTEEVRQQSERDRMIEKLTVDEARENVLRFREEQERKKQGKADDVTDEGVVLTDADRKVLGLPPGDVSRPKTEAEIEAEKVQQIMDSSEEEQKEIEKSFDKQIALVDASAQSQISDIKSLYGSILNDQREANSRALASFKNFGIRIGAERYAGEINQGILNAEERAGIQRLEKITGTMVSAINEAQVAADEKKYSLFLEKRQALTKARERYIEELKEVRSKAFESRQAALENLEKTKRQTRVAEVISGGTKNPLDVFLELGGEVPFDEVIEVTGALPESTFDPKDQFTLGPEQVRFDGDGNVVARGIKAGGGFGVGGGTPSGIAGTVNETGLPDPRTANADERRTMERIIRQLPTRLKDNVAERPILEQNILADIRRGMNFQAIADEMKGFVLEDGVDTGVANVFRNLATGSGVDLAELSANINNGQYEKAMVLVENGNLENAEGSLAPLVDAQEMIRQINRIVVFLDEVPAERLGAFDGREFRVERFIGKDLAATDQLEKNEKVKVQQLETALVALQATIRNKLAGTAVTASEAKFLDPILADILDQPAIIKTKIEVLRTNVVSAHNSARAQVALPMVDESQLLDNELRLELYRDAAAEVSRREYENVSNAQLLEDITSGYETVSGGANQKSHEDFWNDF